MAFTREYTTQNITLPLHVSIKKEPKFEVSNISGSLKQGSTSLINVTYTNLGETPLKLLRQDCCHETSQYQYVNFQAWNSRSGRVTAASFEILATSDAVVKNYGIDSEVRYIDNDGKTRFSENMKVYMPIEKSESNARTTTIVGILLALIFIYQIVKVLRNRKKYSENESGDEND